MGGKRKDDKIIDHPGPGEYENLESQGMIKKTFSK